MDKQLQERADQDEQDIRESLGGDQASFGRLVSRYFGLSFAAALSIVRQREAAEEVAQEAFLKAWLNLSALNRKSSFPSWVMEISRNTARDWVRKGRRRFEILPLVPLDGLNENIADLNSESISETAERKQEQQLVREAILALEPELQELVLLHYSEDLSKSEIARVTGVHPSTVARQLDRVHAELHLKLEPVLKSAARTLKPTRAASQKTIGLIAGLALLPAAQQTAIAASLRIEGAGASLAPASSVAPAGKPAIVPATKAGWSIKPIIIAGTLVVAGIGVFFTPYFARLYEDQNIAAQKAYAQAPSRSPVAPQPSDRASVRASQKIPHSGTTSNSASRAASFAHKNPAAYGPLPAANVLAEVIGKVVDSQGHQPVAGATVAAVSKHGVPLGAKPNATTAQDGSFRLTNVEPGALGLYVTTPNHAPVIQEVTAPTGDAMVTLGGSGARLSGRVVHAETGDPVSNTTVTLSLKQSVFNTYGIEPPTAISNSDGTFAFDHLVPGEYFVDAEAKDMGLLAERPGLFSFSKVDVKLYQLDEGDNEDGVKLRMYDGHTITGIIRDSSTGKPLAGVKLKSTGSDGRVPKQTAITDANGKYRMEHVTGSGGLLVWFHISKLGFTHKSEKQRGDDNSPMFDLPRGDLTVTRDFTMAPAIAVSGIIKDEEGRPLEGALVIVVADCTADHQILDRTDASGRYEAALPAHCNAMLTVSRKDTPVAWQPIKTEDSPITQDIVMISGATAGGVVIDGNGLPIVGAAVEAAVPSIRYGNTTSYSNTQLGQTRTDANGRFAISNLPRADITLTAKKEGYAEAPLAMQITESGLKDEAVIEMSGGKELRGVVTSADGEPVSGVEIRLWDKNSIDRNIYAKSNADGSFAFTSLPDRAMVVSAEHPTLGKASQEATPGQEPVTLVLGGPDSPRPLKVVLIDWKTGAPVQDFDIISFGRRGPEKACEPGVFSQQDVEPGSSVKYKIKAPGYADLDTGYVKTPDAGSTTGLLFAMGPGGTIEGRLKHPAETTASLSGIAVSIPGEAGKATDEVKTVTDASGAFRLKHVPEGKITVKIQPPPPAAELSREVEVAHGESVQLGDLELVRGSGVAGQITMGADQQPLAGVEVEIGLLNEEPRKTETDTSGNYWFTGLGNLSYYMSVPHYNLKAFVAPDGRPGGVETVNFRLGTATVNGQVLRNGAPVSGAAVSFHNGDAWWNATSTNGGRFIVRSLPAGEYNVTADGGGQSGRMIVHLADGQTTDIVVQFDSGTLRGRVVDTDGKALAQVYVTTVRQTNVKQWRTAYSALTDDEGGFSFTNRPAGRYAVAATLNDQLITPVYFADIPAGGMTPQLEVKVTGESASIISITRKPDGSPRSDAKTAIIASALGVYHRPATKRDDQGQLVVNNLPPGSYKITLSAPGADSITHDVELTNGQTAKFVDTLN